MGPIIGLTLALDSRPPLPSTWTVLLRMTLRSSRRDPFEVVTASGGHFVKREKKVQKMENWSRLEAKQLRNTDTDMIWNTKKTQRERELYSLTFARYFRRLVQRNKRMMWAFATFCFKQIFAFISRKFSIESERHTKTVCWYSVLNDPMIFQVLLAVNIYKQTFRVPLCSKDVSCIIFYDI